MLADEWSINGVPEKYSKYFDDIDEISSDTVKIMRDKLGLTWHEGGNMQDIFLISKDYHNGCHIGAVGQMRNY